MSNRRSFKMTKIPMIFILCALFATLASSSPIGEGTINGDARMNEPDIKKCLESKPCIITFDFTPTCASDGKTYSNERVIGCLNECLKQEDKLTVASRGYCKSVAVPVR
ncbi:uncharacterized protein LOC123317356 [Coccinella septempunctata]|uniref:uncharacterized protein LOC123317356 n=1 Tax=Coccinella septempunctata TaxID=41139 RepID=UPI001D06B8A0|nr:uncharacterized protein LOC123317356 [Coccinella septempunctata]